VASDVELQRDGVSYTVDTLEALRSARPERELVLIVGSDTLAELGGWRAHERIFALCTVAVVERPGQAEAATPQGARLARVPGDGLPIAASDLRRRVRDGASIRYLVPEPVADYIRKRGLYR
jgi:nicotinate-nucleotide adenylyltransferase